MSKTSTVESSPILIAGPTASGKSALALDLAERIGGIVVNADALQVYDGWRALTARPRAADEARVPHALYGHVSMAHRYSLGHWLRDLAPVLSAAARDRQRPVIVGGTGLYFAGLTTGLAPIPPIPPEVRDRSETIMATGGFGAMRDDLARRDAETLSAIDAANPARVQRAWEVLEATGTGLSAWQRHAVAPMIDPARTVRIVLNPPPEALATRIAARFDAMLAAGALDEARQVVQAGWQPARPSSKALGAAALVAHIEGRMSLAEARDAAVVATRQFAKRQRTWFRGRMSEWTWIAPEPGEAARLARRLAEL
jgi:tRNA dimethylallyltransferase